MRSKSSSVSFGSRIKVAARVNPEVDTSDRLSAERSLGNVREASAEQRPRDAEVFCEDPRACAVLL